MVKKRISGKDVSPRKEFAKSRGEVWVEMKDDKRSLGRRSAEAIIESISQYVRDAKLGKYSGKSRGSGALDISFSVSNRADAIPRIREFMSKSFRSLTFSVSDDYESKFHVDKPLTPAEHLAQLAELAAMLANSLQALVASAAPKKRKT